MTLCTFVWNDKSLELRNTVIGFSDLILGTGFGFPPTEKEDWC